MTECVCVCVCPHPEREMQLDVQEKYERWRDKCYVCKSVYKVAVWRWRSFQKEIL